MKCHKLVHHLGPGWKISTNTRWITMIINMGTRTMKCYSQGVIPHVIALVTRMSHPELCWASRQSRQQKVHNVQNPQIMPAITICAYRHVYEDMTSLWCSDAKLCHQGWDNRLYSGWCAPRCPQRRCSSGISYSQRLGSSSASSGYPDNRYQRLLRLCTHHSPISNLF